MSPKSLSEKLLNNRIPFPAASDAAESRTVRAQPDKSERLREFSLRFAEIFRGQNNAEIARKIGTTDAVVKNYVEGKRFPNDDLLLAITRATRVNLHWLLTGEGSRRIEPETSIFSEEEKTLILTWADRHRRSFDDEVRALALAAAGFLEKL